MQEALGGHRDTSGRKLPSPTFGAGVDGRAARAAAWHTERTGGGGVCAERAQPDTTGDAVVPPDFFFGVATAGFQIEGGYNGAGQPANNWLAWEQTGRVEPSGNAVGFWERPEESLDRAAALGCNTFRLGIEWARVFPEDGPADRHALERYAQIVQSCTDRGLEPLVTIHHFTHPEWLGEEFWLRPDAPERFRQWTDVAVDALGAHVRLWVTLNEINVVAIGSWLLGMFPPGRYLSWTDAALALDNLLTAHVLAYEMIHRARPDATVTTNNSGLSVYEYDRMLIDLLLSRSAGIGHDGIDEWIRERRRRHCSLLPSGDPRERAMRVLGSVAPPYGPALYGAERGLGISSRRRFPRRALDAVFESPHESTLDVLGIDFYDPMVGRHLRRPGHRTAGGHNPLPTRELWDDVPDPSGFARWLGIEHDRAPSLPIWVVENGLCNRVRHGRSYERLDGWKRSRYLREFLAALVAAREGGVPVTGYWHWSLVDNYEWGSYEPRFGLYGLDRHRGEHGARWLDTDSMGDDAAGTYRAVIEGLRAGDRRVLDGAATGGSSG